MRAIFDFHLDAQELAHPLDDRFDPFTRLRAFGYLGLPGQAQQQESIVLIASEDFRPLLKHLHIVRESTAMRCPDLLRTSTPSHQTISARLKDDGSLRRSNGTTSTRENPSETSGGSSSR